MKTENMTTSEKICLICDDEIDTINNKVLQCEECKQKFHLVLIYILIFLLNCENLKILRSVHCIQKNPSKSLINATFVKPLIK